MKKIKKILPLLLGVLVLMFGTLTVSASENDVDWNEFYSNNGGLTEKYPYMFIRDYGNVYSILFSTCPLEVPKNRIGMVMTLDGQYASGQCNKNTLQFNGSVNKFSGSKGGLISCGGISVEEYVYTNYDIWEVGADKSVDKPVFRGPAPLVAVAEVLPVVVRERTTLILTTAVVCLALLVILSVLPKKLPRFLNR